MILLLLGNERDRIETLTPYAEWSQFMVYYFFGNLTYFTGGFRSLDVATTTNAMTREQPYVTFRNNVRVRKNAIAVVLVEEYSGITVTHH